MQLHAKRGGEVEFTFANPLQDAIEKNKVNILTQILGLAGGIAQIAPQAVPTAYDWTGSLQDAGRGAGAPEKWSLDEEIAKALQKQQAIAGNIIQGLGVAQQAADVVKTGSDAAAQLQQIGLLPAPQGGAGGPA
jgi:hypothetical protein